MFSHPLRLASISAAMLASVSAASAAETVTVDLEGERGGAMAIELSRSEVPAGEVTFAVNNVADDTPHEMVVVKLDEAGMEIPVDPATEKADESQLDTLGEVSGLKAGQSGELTVDLEPGDYKLICNYKGHLAAGMVAPFTVTGS